MFFKKREASPQPQVVTRTGRRPGQSAREKQQAIADASPVKPFFTRLFDIHTDERAWRRGADGEELVGELLEQLRPHGWHVEHDVRVGQRGANLDHLVIGPPGVFVLNTKAVRGKVWVGGPVVMVGHYRTDFVENLDAEAQRVRRCLTEATGRSALWVQGLLVFVHQQPVVKRSPRYVAVLHHSELVRGLLAQPAKLSPNEVEELVRAARREETWMG
ncbi:NERD domain-containing protein [Myxococcus sp. AM009]|uniref:nuclease-related domain-containing protein n=1 Tax=unclassified Myxococcus TaxID=2648731 RepID=UPI001594F613|nr:MULTISPECIES: nuclease-related domain-containing protein [unclassified Myxococcus]NVJ03098.1 NERD domain-containing protein [Myxococcus sp. AM009]NVJ19442.1 NERD domain-containing protein [Myxococcus sp. AM010]